MHVLCRNAHTFMLSVDWGRLQIRKYNVDFKYKISAQFKEPIISVQKVYILVTSIAATWSC